MKKILIYNWIPFDESMNKGGGVTVYTKNLIEELINSGEYSIYFLSSGRAYDAVRQEIYIEETRNIFGENCKSYQVVNSPVLSSAHLSFPYPQDMLMDTKLKGVIRYFLEQINGVDVIHFQNLEGLSLSVLELKEEFQDTLFVYSLHNYYPFCPQVMLWQENNRNCNEPCTGTCCVKCMPRDVYKEKVVLNQKIQFLKDNDNPISDRMLIELEELKRVCEQKEMEGISCDRANELSEFFAIFREKNVEYINKYFDIVLCVSKRVKEIAERFGIKNELLSVDYIGTKVANSQVEKVSYLSSDGKMRLCYLGYARENKGFFFLVKALEELDDNYLSRLSITFATPIEDLQLRERLKKLDTRMAKLEIVNGYTHDELENLLRGVNLGIVPPLWEDNLPQVAIEFKAFGIPVLCSDMGGASELTSAAGFVFEGGNIEDFHRKLTAILDGKVSLESYFTDGMKLRTMKEHITSLKIIYNGIK